MPNRMPPQIDEELRQSMTLDEQLAFLGPYFYFQAKAARYLQKGPAAYRRDDYFHFPREEWSAEALASLECGFRQIGEWRGITASLPLEGLTLKELYLMMEVIHFQVEQFSAVPTADGMWLGSAKLHHRVQNDQLTLIYRFRPDSASISANQPPSETFGYMPDNPIPCDDPSGERFYLSRLLCPNGHRFGYRRVGSLSGRCSDIRTHKSGDDDDDKDLPHCIVDLYELQCQEGEHRCRLYFDMYHPRRESQQAPVGLSLSASPLN